MKTNKQNDNWNAQYYKKNSEGQFKRGMNAIQGLSFRGDENVLDVGCGDGRITAEIAKMVANGHVLGIDISANMIAEAHKSFSDIRNLEFKCMDAAQFSSNNEFDLAVSFAAFHWVKSQTAVLKNIFNALKPGGKLVIKMTAVCNNSHVSKVHASAKWAPILSKKEQTYFPQTVESLGDMLELVGFRNIDVTLKIVERTFQSKDELFNSVFAWVPYFTGLPEAEAREFTQDIVDLVCKARDDGKIILENANLDATAIKF